MPPPTRTYDRDVLYKYCRSHGLTFDEQVYGQIIRDVRNDHVKDQTGRIKNACNVVGSISAYHFKIQLAKCITSVSAVPTPPSYW